MIAFSVLIHEKVEIVIDQINNFQRFNPGSIIILHISKQFRSELGESLEQLKNISNVFINPVSLNTGLGDNSQLFAHLENMRFIVKQSLNFDYFSFHASNDMFVRKGLYAYLMNFEAGSDNLLIDDKPEWVQRKAALKDKLLKKLVHENRITIRGSQIEGSFMNRHTAIKTIETANKYNIGPNYTRFELFLNRLFKIRYFRKLIRVIFPGVFYAKEEVYFSTIINMCAKNLGRPYVYINWRNNAIIEIEDVKAVIKQDWQFLFNKKNIKNGANVEFFAVKRIARDIKDPIRQYINMHC